MAYRARVQPRPSSSPPTGPERYSIIFFSTNPKHGTPQDRAFHADFSPAAAAAAAAGGGGGKAA